MIPVSWDWFIPFQNATRDGRYFQNTTGKKQDDERYESIKSNLGKKIWDKIIEIDPQFKNRLIFSNFLTPLGTKHI